MLEGFCIFKFPGDAEVVGLGNHTHRTTGAYTIMPPLFLMTLVSDAPGFDLRPNSDLCYPNTSTSLLGLFHARN